MRIKTSGSTHTFYRYGGQVEGKTTEVKIGGLPVGTLPGQIPIELSDDLTPKEMRELVEHLQSEQSSIARSRLVSLMDDLEIAAQVANVENLDTESSRKLADLLSRLQSVVRRIDKSRSVRVVPPEAQP